MNLEQLPVDVREHLTLALNLLDTTEEKLGFWEVSDYGICEQLGHNLCSLSKSCS